MKPILICESCGFCNARVIPFGVISLKEKQFFIVEEGEQEIERHLVCPICHNGYTAESILDFFVNECEY